MSPVKLAAARVLHPLDQGELDSLCGLYAIINAFRLAKHPHAPLSDAAVERLFARGIQWLDAQGTLGKALNSGMSQRTWRALAAHLSSHFTRPGRPQLLLQPLLTDRATSTPTAFARIAAVIERQSPVLALIYEDYFHFTVISGVSDTRVSLFDSYGYHWVERRSCSFRRASPPTRHRFAPNALLAVQLRSTS